MGLQPFSGKTDVSTRHLFFKSLCAFHRPTHHQYDNKRMYLCINREGIISRTSELPNIIFFPGVWNTAHVTLSLPGGQNLKEAFVCLNCQNRFSACYFFFFQPDNDLFLSSTVSYLAYLSKLERKNNHLMWRMLLSLANAALSLIIIPVI